MVLSEELHWKRFLLSACAFSALFVVTVLILNLQSYPQDLLQRKDRSQNDAEHEKYWTSRILFFPSQISPQQNVEQLDHFPSFHALSEADISASEQCCMNFTDRFDCFPESLHPSQEACRARGCCWDNSTARKGAPVCYFVQNAGGYRVVSLVPLKLGNATVGLKATLQRNSTSAFPDDIKLLHLLVFFRGTNQVRFRIIDPSTQRYEVPIEINNQHKPVPESATDYRVSINKDPFSISIVRKSDGQPIFDSCGMAPLIFADQYLQIASRLSSRFVYGLGEHRSSLLLNIDWQKLVFWNRDQYPKENSNLYGSHPFYLNLEPSGNAHGVFLLNSNAMQVDLQPYQQTGAITYRVLGGILDFFVFLGPSPEDVVRQYVSLIGHSFLPPFWALGFHLCKHGYGNSSEFWEVIQRNRAARMPYDVQWSDLDYAKDNKVWTWDNETYRGLPDIVHNLHDHGQHYIIIVEPGVSSSQPPGTYLPFDMGLRRDVFLKNASGQVLVGKVWPGHTAFVDFFYPKSIGYWVDLIMNFHEVLSFDGLWLDMNEPSNFIDGSVNGCTNNSLDNPPFVPPGIDGGTLYAKTVCPSARQAFTSHYNMHNMYGWFQLADTTQCLEMFYNKRSLVITRATAPGSGAYGGHWTGDNLSSFPDMHFSIPGILTSNMLGISMVGADICGFRGNTTRELCIRWMQLGAFYPFMRNHAEVYSVPQDPGWFDSEAQSMMRAALETRYSLLPYLYTRFFISHSTGAPVVRPLFFDYPGTESIDRQFLWGSELLISPVLEQGATTVKAYIPRGSWFDLHNLTALDISGGDWYTLQAPLEKINVHVRGGSILPMLPPAVTTTLARQKKMELLVAPNLNSGPLTATGQLYWDDGTQLAPLMRSAFTDVKFSLHKTSLTSVVSVANYGPVTLGKVTVMRVSAAPSYVTLSDKAVDFYYDRTTQVLVIPGLSVNLLIPFKLTWY